MSDTRGTNIQAILLAPTGARATQKIGSPAVASDGGKRKEVDEVDSIGRFLWTVMFIIVVLMMLSFLGGIIGVID